MNKAVIELQNIKRNFQVGDETVHALSDHTQTFLNSLFKCAADSHHLSYRLHAGTQFAGNAMEFTQVPTRYLADHIVQGGFEESACSLCHRVVQVEQAIAQAEFCRYKRQRITRCFRGKCRRTAQACIYLDYPVVLAHRVVGILHVTLSHNADVTDNADSKFTQFMIVRIAQRL